MSQQDSPESNGPEELAKKIVVGTACVVLGSLVLGVIGAVIGGPPGAVLGAKVGAILGGSAGGGGAVS